SRTGVRYRCGVDWGIARPRHEREVAKIRGIYRGVFLARDTGEPGWNAKVRIVAGDGRSHPGLSRTGFVRRHVDNWHWRFAPGRFQPSADCDERRKYQQHAALPDSPPVRVH